MSFILKGRGDVYQNYLWKTLEVWVDTTGDGKYDHHAATLKGGGQGEFRFPKSVPATHGLELRATEQKTGGGGLAFILNTIGDLIFADEPDETSMIHVVEDFEDFGSWRTWGLNTAQPDGERAYGQNLWLSGVYDPERAYEGQGIGEFRYWFGDTTPRCLWAKRIIVNQVASMLEEIRFMANPQGYPCAIWFELTDSDGRKFQTPRVPLQGVVWREYAVSINAKTIPQLPNLKPPFKMEIVFLEGGAPGKGDVLLDNISFVGAVARGNRVQIKRIFEGMVHDPGQSLTPRYRVRNVQGQEISLSLQADLYSSFDPNMTQAVAGNRQLLNMSPFEVREIELDFGTVGQGHYLVQLSVRAPGVEVDELDQLAVARLNQGRVNESPMWFGSMHPGGWLATPENEFIREYVIKGIGLDAYRTSAPEEWMREYNLLAAAGFGSMPPYLRKPGEDHRGAPNNYEAYYEWVKEQAREKYLPYLDSILSVEFYNEPDLPGFEFFPEIGDYLKMHETFRRAFRDVHPDFPIGTGGNTVVHGRAKKDFNPRMYRELAGKADVAIFHAHGSLENYINHHRQVEAWLEEGGVPPGQALIGNSEAGNVSGSLPAGWLNQADNLVRKIGWAAAQGNSLFYIWFTTTDTFDPQGGYLWGDNWGLVNYRQRLKASGLAYNELIRKLANTRPGGEVHLGSQVQTVRFEREADGAPVWITWPNQRGARFLLPLMADGPVTVSDMFGRAEVKEPRAGRIQLTMQGHPLYLEAAPGVTLLPGTGSEWVDLPANVGGAPGTTVTLQVTLRNPGEQAGTVVLRVLDTGDRELASRSVSMAAGAEETVFIPLPISENLAWGLHGHSLRLDTEIKELEGLVLPFSLIAALPVPRVDASNEAPLSADIGKAAVIVLDDKEQIHDFAYDPSTPYWAGPGDLSVKARFAHDGKGIHASFDVTDPDHFPGGSGADLWNGDSIQLAVSARGANTQIGLTTAGGGSTWCWISTHGGLAGKEPGIPFAIKRVDGRIHYSVFLPFDSLGFEYEPGLQIRLAFLVNEADKSGGRVRVIHWFDGILAGQGPELYGHMILE